MRKALVFVAMSWFMCNPHASLNLGSFDWKTPEGDAKKVHVELYNAGENMRGIDLDADDIRYIFNYAIDTCGSMDDCDPHTKETYIVVDPMEWWLVFKVRGEML